jgi:sodium-dependent dicarboxylate transporter 2/3/5
MPQTSMPSDAAPSSGSHIVHARWVALAIALLSSLLVVWRAPADWTPEDASARLQAGSATATAPLESGALLMLNGVLGATVIDAAPSRVAMCVRRLNDGTLPDLQLLLPDGRVQSIPVQPAPDAEGCHMATLRPLQGGGWALALLALIGILLLTEALPLHATALAVPVLAGVLGIAGARDLLAPFFHPVIALFFAGFMLAQAMARSGLDQMIGIRVLRRVGTSPGRLFAALIALAAFLSMWMSNTAAMATLLPIVMAVTAGGELTGLRRGLVLATAYASSIGGIGSAIGTPSNPMAMAYLSEFAGRTMTFSQWFPFGLPMVILLLPVMGLLVWMRTRQDVDATEFRAGVSSLLQLHRPVTRAQVRVLAVFILMVGGWLTEALHGVEASLVGLAGVIVLTTTADVTTSDVRSISWDALLVFGGGLCLGEVLVKTGASDWIATQLSFLAILPPWLAVGAVGTLTLALSAIASNTAAAATVLPLSLPLAVVVGVDPTLMVVVVAIASSIDFALVVGTPPTMIAYSTGLFTVGEIFRVGVLVDLAGLLLLVLVLPWVWTWLGVI